MINISVQFTLYNDKQWNSRLKTDLTGFNNIVDRHNSSIFSCNVVLTNVSKSRSIFFNYDAKFWVKMTPILHWDYRDWIRSFVG